MTLDRVSISAQIPQMTEVGITWSINALFTTVSSDIELLIVPSSTVISHSQNTISLLDGEPNFETRHRAASMQTLFSVGISYVNISIRPARKIAMASIYTKYDTDMYSGLNI